MNYCYFKLLLDLCLNILFFVLQIPSTEKLRAAHFRPNNLYQSIRRPNTLNIPKPNHYHTDSTFQEQSTAAAKPANSLSSASPCSVSPTLSSSQTSPLNGFDCTSDNSSGSSVSASAGDHSRTAKTAIVQPFCESLQIRSALPATAITPECQKRFIRSGSLSAGNSPRKASAPDVSTEHLMRLIHDSKKKMNLRNSLDLGSDANLNKIKEQRRRSWAAPASLTGSETSQKLVRTNNDFQIQDQINQIINELNNYDAEANTEGCDEERGQFAFTNDQTKNLNVNKSTNMTQFKKLLLQTRINVSTTQLKSSASELLKVQRPSPNTSPNGKSSMINERRVHSQLTDQVNQLNHSSPVESVKSADNVPAAQFAGALSTPGGGVRTRIINGRLYKTSYRLEAMYPPIQEDNAEEEQSGNSNKSHSMNEWLTIN